VRQANPGAIDLIDRHTAHLLEAFYALCHTGGTVRAAFALRGQLNLAATCPPAGVCPAWQVGANRSYVRHRDPGLLR